MDQIIVLASKNAKKLHELQVLFDFPEVEVKALDTFEPIMDVEEDGDTFEANAIKKACEYARQTGCLTIADDSGLCIDALGGKPGVFSARYAGDGKDDTENIICVLTELRGIQESERTARFETAVALAHPEEGLIDVVFGTCHGFIADEPRGTQGFGYDPIFYYPSFSCTFAQASPEQKNTVSHRAQALAKMKKVLENYLYV